eukprot:COSAG06_NODE_2395_length_6958_cov_4.127132_1_plen_131_part_00
MKLQLRLLAVGVAAASSAAVAAAGDPPRPNGAQPHWPHSPVGPAAVAALLSPHAASCDLKLTASAGAVLILFVDDWGWGDLGANCFAMAAVPGARPDRLDKETACDSATNKTLEYEQSAAQQGKGGSQTE